MEPNWQLSRKRATLFKRARIIQQIRAFFIERDFLEVETPHRIPANAPEYHIDAIEAEDWFLQTSPELCMKRLLAAGYERLFQICRCWRRGERGTRHLPEYSMLEWYRLAADYKILMDDCESLLTTLVPDQRFHWHNNFIDLTPPWPRLSVAEAFACYSPISLDDAIRMEQVDLVVSEHIEKKLPSDRPLILFDYPLECASLARRKAENPKFAERFEVYLGGLEIANGFSELTDPVEQRRRFDEEENHRRRAGKIPYPSPQPFLDELTTLAPAAGIALGIDRLVMLLCRQPDIAEVVAFTPEQL